MALFVNVYSSEEMVNEVRKLVGDQFVVTAYDNGIVEVISKNEYRANILMESGPPIREYRLLKPIILISEIKLRQHEKIADIAKVNKYLELKINIIAKQLLDIPHDEDSKTKSMNGFNPRNDNDFGLIAEYDLLRAGIRPMPEFGYNGHYYKLNCRGYEFEDKNAELLFAGVCGKLANLKLDDF
jgi:hypothetical protein